ncbi:hypothetical protein Skr01_63260 [Sphaerisporangium krabiense]|nr:hypothetical protein Skr01_63260 [Sphaerisporangium krabiense]
MAGGAPRVVWFIWPTDPQRVSAKSIAQRLVQIKQPAHLVWNPVSGQIVQSLPPTRAANGLPGDLNRQGRVCVQIRVLGSVEEPFTESKLDGLDDILAWLDSWEVPRHWPAGPPLPYPHSLAAQRSRRLWARGGHFGNSQVPGTSEGDPGPIDVHRIVGGPAPNLDVPRPRGDRADHADRADREARDMPEGCAAEKSINGPTGVVI